MLGLKIQFLLLHFKAFRDRVVLQDLCGGFRYTPLWLQSAAVAGGFLSSGEELCGALTPVTVKL